MEQKRSRQKRKDRSSGIYSEEAFKALPRQMQLKLAQKYLMQPTEQFDDGTFQFSYSHFVNVCKEISIVKGVVDARRMEDEDMLIILEHGTRAETVMKQFTFEKETMELLDEVFKNSKKKVGNIEKSKVLNLILKKALKEVVKAKEEGHLIISYRYYAEDIVSPN